MAVYISANESDACPYPPSVLDFVSLSGHTASSVEESWPCEVRTYYVQELKPFVNFVRFIYAYFTPFVVTLGMVLNFFAFRVLSSRTMRGTSLSVYLRALSISDIGVLIFSYATGYWRSNHPAFNELFLDNENICRFHKIIVSMFPMTSQWLQTALTVERLLVVWRPLRARNPAYPQLAVRAARRTVGMVYITLILVALTKWHFSGFEQYSAFEYQRCEQNSHSSVVAVYVYVALSTYLPGTLIFVCNVMLFLRLRRSDSLRRSLFAGSAHDGACYSSDAAARTLVLFSLLYLVLQLPLGVVETAELYWDVTLFRPPANSGPERDEYIYWLNRKLEFKWSRSLLFWLFQLSFVLNFVVYLKSGGRFRGVAKDLAWHWMSCGLSPLRSAGRSLGSLPRYLGIVRSTATCRAMAACSGPEDYGTTTTSVPGTSDSAGIAMSTTVCTAVPMSTSASTGSFSSDSSTRNLVSPIGLGLCWPRQRTRTNSCPHRYWQPWQPWQRRDRASPRGSPRGSPCRPCRRARIQTWANFVRSQGIKVLARNGSDTLDRTFLNTTTSSSMSDVDVDSVFDSPAFVAHPDDPVKPSYPQQDLLSLPLQDSVNAYASPVFCEDPVSRPREHRSQQDLLSSSPLAAAAAGAADLLHPYAPTTLLLRDPGRLDRKVLFRSERALHLAASPCQGHDPGPWPTDTGDCDRRRVSVSVSRTNKKLERYLSEPRK